MRSSSKLADYAADLGIRAFNMRARDWPERITGSRATEHLDGILGEQKGIDDTVQTGARREARGFRLRREMPGLRSGQMELPLQIGSSNVDVAHRHLGINVPEQLHQRR